MNCAVRWYFRFQLSLRDIEELLFERGVVVTYRRSDAGVTSLVRALLIE
jgi:transposase-like protein